MKITATKEFKWDMAHMLENHEGLCKNLHGHTYKMFVTAERTVSALNKQSNKATEGMVCDFKELKELVSKTIVKHLDHATMLNVESSDPCEQELLEVLNKYGKKVVEVDYRPTAENMACDFLAALNEMAELKATEYKIIAVQIYETPTSYAIARLDKEVI